jgi:ATP-dependent Clp endopeptidase proteolytic subunit ClpP
MKRKSVINFGPINKKQKKELNNDKYENYENSDSGDEAHFDLPSLFPNLHKDDNNKIYLKENHLYFHDQVNEINVDLVKKLMRDYLHKITKTKNQNTFMVIKQKPLFLHIYSPGGDVYAGLSLYDFITEYNKNTPVYTVVEGVAASAATIISVAGCKRYITPNSYMLIHQLSTYFGGNFEQIKDEFGNCEKIMKQLKDIYSKRTKLTKNQLTDILKRDINWCANDCKKYGLVDEIKLIDIFNDSKEV